MPDVIVIAGPNGAGKSTLAPALLRDTFRVLEYVNADTIAEGLSAFAPEDASFDAGRVMLGRLHELAETKKDFAFETTLASRFYANWLKHLQSVSGYRVSVVFLWLRSVDFAIARVDARVRVGGHSIPEETIRRRFERGTRNFFELYVPVADSWRFFNAGTRPATEIARYTQKDGENIFDSEVWNEIRK
ncbi:MAG TPA: zeta toxin family protein [Pyrinomonadaceae bacterium]|nr:zeta toxin family protein [Pyrinomonadaceae bacterium]